MHVGKHAYDCAVGRIIVFFWFIAEDIPELLSSSSLFSMLLPLIIAYIGPVAAAIPKVCSSNAL